MSKRNIVVTGTTSGIGKELVKILSQDDDNTIYAGYRNKELVEEYPNVKNFYIDMTNRDSIAQAAKCIMSKISKVDILINIAGCVVAGPIEKLDTDLLRKQFDVNTFSHLEFTQNLLPVLDNSRIINISSMACFGLYPFISPYCASKRALDMLFNAFALENHKNIKVISIKPGVIATPIWKKSVECNEENLTAYTDYRKEMLYMKDHALANSNKGIKVEDAAKFIKTIAYKKNPKSSYTLGFDAKISQILSLLPQDFANSIVKFGMDMRIK